MIATMSPTGVITLQAETSVEAYALKHWTSEALVVQKDISRAEDCHWRGSHLIVKAFEPKEAES